LLVPVPEAEPLVGPWRARYDPPAPQGIPAHVTVLYPFVPPDQFDDAVGRDLASMFGSVPAFDFHLARTARFPGVLYLAPEPAAPFLGLIGAVVSRWPEHPPYGGQFESVIPHLTVADCQEPGACEDPVAVMDEVERAIVGGVPIKARAREVWLMVGPDPWTLRQRFPLGG
jgi:2'-5' RNA ligase